MGTALKGKLGPTFLSMWSGGQNGSVDASDLRQRRSVYVRYALAVALIAIVANIVQNLALFEPRNATHYALWGIALATNILALLVWTTSPKYPNNRWFDLLLASPLIVLMEGITRVDSSQATFFGFIPAATHMGDYMLAVAFVSTFFAGNFRAYAIWTGLHASAFFVSLQLADATGEQIAQASSFYLPILVISLYLNWAIEAEGRKSLFFRRQLEEEKEKTESLLFNVLPQEVAERLRRGEAVADAYSDATVIFLDLAGSSQLARTLSPKHFIRLLDEIFSIADRCASRHGVEKVKTIGDAYLAISGARVSGSPLAAVNFAIDASAQIQTLASDQGIDLNVRVGLHSGPVIGGVIGNTKATYDYWGDTMNIAARVEGVAEIGGIAVTKQVYWATRSAIPYNEPRIAALKGIGDLEVYDIAGRSN